MGDEVADPVIDELRALRETSWRNPGLRPAAEALPEVGLTVADISDMAAGPAPFREAMRVPGTVPLGSSGPDGLDRPPRG